MKFSGSISEDFKANEFSMGVMPMTSIGPSNEKSELASIPTQNISWESDSVPKIAPAINAPQADMSLVEDVAITSQNLRNDYKGPEATPKGDISYMSDTIGKATTELFGALSTKTPEYEMAQVRPQHNATFAL